MNRLFTVFLSLLLLTSMQACALSGARSGHAIDGRVLEAGTNKPIPDAIVVARWIGHLAGYADGKTVCYHVMSATTDVNGKYSMPTWRKEITEEWQKNVSPEEVRLDVYKAEYEKSSVLSKSENLQYLNHSTQGRVERLEYLLRISSATRCGGAGESQKSLLSLKKALYEEAITTEISTEDQDKIETLLFGLESLEFGSTEALNRMIERRKGKK